MRKHLVVTGSGGDRPGVIERFTRVILDHHGNVEASRMSRLGGAFAMLMLISAPEADIPPLQAALDAVCREDDFQLNTRLTDLAQAEGETKPAFTPCGIIVSGADHLGIIHQIARYLAEQGINVESMSTEVVAAPMSGAPLFTMQAVVRVPSRLTVADLEEALDEIGHEVGVEASIFDRG
jgi:glycine cleavage system transcriptional repressor